MRKYISLLCFSLLIAIILSGCKRADFAENQAYAVMLGIDVENSRDIKLTIRYPKLSASSGGSDGGENSSYASGAATGGTFQQALESLKTIIAREINLSALTMVIIS
jgi:hypothetical protein